MCFRHSLRMRLSRKPFLRALRLLIPVIIVPLLLPSCTARAPAKAADVPAQRHAALRVGFSQMENNNPWRVAETNSIREEAQRRGDELLYMDAASSTTKQVEDVNWLIAQRVDYIILAPREYEALAPAIENARTARVPLILVDRAARGVPGKDYLTLIASDFFQQGERAGMWLAKATGGKANIVELQGTLDASPTTDRKRGFESAIARFPGMKIIDSETGEFVRTLGQKVMESMIKSHHKEITAVFSHNDEMAIGAIQALKAAGFSPGKDVLLVSVDGNRDALKAIVAGELGASIECNPRLGPKAFDVIEEHRGGRTVPPVIVVPDRMFDTSNARQNISGAF